MKFHLLKLVLLCSLLIKITSEVHSQNNEDENDEIAAGDVDTLRKGPVPHEVISRLLKLESDTIPLEFANDLFSFLKKSSDTTIPIATAEFAKINIDDDNQSEILIHLDAEQITDRYYLLKEENKIWFAVASIESHGSHFDAVPAPAFEWEKDYNTLIVPLTTGWGMNSYFTHKNLFFKWQDNNLHQVLCLTEITGGQDIPFTYGSLNYFNSSYKIISKDTLLITHFYTEEVYGDIFPKNWKLSGDTTINLFHYEAQIHYAYNRKEKKFQPILSNLSIEETEFLSVYMINTEYKEPIDKTAYDKWKKKLINAKKELAKNGNKYQKWYYKHYLDKFKTLSKE